jgi:hypothetical protein
VKGLSVSHHGDRFFAQAVPDLYSGPVGPVFEFIDYRVGYRAHIDRLGTEWLLSTVEAGDNDEIVKHLVEPLRASLDQIRDGGGKKGFGSLLLIQQIREADDGRDRSPIFVIDVLQEA